MILAGDIGGTHSRFGWFLDGRCIVERRLANADFSGFADVLAAVLGTSGTPEPTAVCFALAGPVDDDGRHAQLTNLPWPVDAAALEASFSLPPVRLVNDFAAAAIGAVTCAAAHRVLLQSGEPVATAPRLVIGAGTGLGMAVVLPAAGGEWRVLPGEGGHVAFAPADAEQVQLLQALQARHGRVTWERVVSGPGLEFIYRHICESNREPPVLQIEAFASAPAGSAAARAIDLFLRCYGAYAGDMALALLARGSVHLAGGIAPRLLPQLAAGGFLDAFNGKAEHAALARRMPVEVCTDPQLGLRGAAALAGAKA